MPSIYTRKGEVVVKFKNMADFNDTCKPHGYQVSAIATKLGNNVTPSAIAKGRSAVKNALVRKVAELQKLDIVSRDGEELSSVAKGNRVKIGEAIDKSLPQLVGISKRGRRSNADLAKEAAGIVLEG